jgi:flagellar basal-body rod protein FlgC
MSIDAILEATRAGLQNERLRLDLAGRNIAGANQAIDPARLAAMGEGFAATLAAGGMSPGEPIATRSVLDPGHPMADAQGRVHYPAVDMVHEMTTMMTASRGYEANVRSFNVLRSMVLRAMEIGAK